MSDLFSIDQLSDTVIAVRLHGSPLTQRVDSVAEWIAEADWSHITVIDPATGRSIFVECATEIDPGFITGWIKREIIDANEFAQLMAGTSVGDLAVREVGRAFIALHNEEQRREQARLAMIALNALLQTALAFGTRVPGTAQR